MHHTHAETRASLILRLQDAGDVAAWDEFAAIYAPVLYRVAVARGLQSADAEDLVQEVFLAVAHSVGDWLDRPDRGPFRHWLLRITRNQAVDLLTRRATRPLGRNDSHAGQRLADRPASDELTPELNREYERSLFHRAAEQVRREVAPHTWEAFRLTAVEELSAAEAAKRLDTRPGNIYFGRSRVMSKIRDFVRQYEEEL